MGSPAELDIPLDGTPAQTFRVLIADDDEWTRNLLRSYLVHEGVEVDTVRNGREAMTSFLQTRPDIVFLDVEMPGSTGLDVLARIREEQAETAVIITTAYGSEDVVVKALRRGADDYLRKPFERSDFQAVLDRTTARMLLRRQNAALRARVLDHQHRIEHELARAAQVVAALLPPVPPLVAGFEMAAACVSAREMGGDFYDWQKLPSNRLSVTVGDVMGKGLPAALLMATVRAVVRALVPDSDPTQVVTRAGSAIAEDLARAGAFVTLFHAQVDTVTGEVRYIDAGHGYVLVRRSNGTVEELTPRGLPLGVDATESTQAEGTVTLDPGDTLMIYSDGLTAARPDLFALREQVAAFAAPGSDAAAVVRSLTEAVAQVRPLPDDVTLVVVRRQPVE
jgi:serine phosphatase RsbU (regulator of sigma subunit)